MSFLLYSIQLFLDYKFSCEQSCYSSLYQLIIPNKGVICFIKMRVLLSPKNCDYFSYMRAQLQKMSGIRRWKVVNKQASCISDIQPAPQCASDSSLGVCITIIFMIINFFDLFITR